MAQLRQYATTGEFDSSPITTGTTTDQALVAASLDIDQLLLTAVYDTDEDGLPTDQDIIDALREATCAQAQYAAGLGDPVGVGAGRIVSGRIGSVQLQRAGAGGKTVPSRYSTQARQILQQAGLLNFGPWTW